MKFACADPPYIGCGQSHYGHLHPEAAKWDDPASHVQLLHQLIDEFPDGWALCMHEPTLKILMQHKPDDVRVGAWVKPFCRWRESVVPAYAWEPVFFKTTRWNGKQAGRDSVRDYVAANINMDQSTPGAKPRAFWFWLFDVWCAEPADTFVDMFPGSGGGTVAWHEYTNTTRPGVVDTIPMFGDTAAWRCPTCASTTCSRVLKCEAVRYGRVT